MYNKGIARSTAKPKKTHEVQKMQVRNPNPQILSAAAAMLATFAPELSPTALLEAVKSYNPGAGKTAPIPIEKPLTRRDVAALLGCSLNSINRYLNSGKLRRIRITDRSVRIDPASVKALLSMEEPQTIQQAV